LYTLNVNTTSWETYALTQFLTWLYVAVVVLFANKSPVLTSGTLSFVSSCVIFESSLSEYETVVIDFLSAKSKYSFLAITSISLSAPSTVTSP